MATQAEIARHLDLNGPRYVRELIDRGVLPSTGDLEACRVAYIRHLREAAAGRGGAGQGDLTAERTREAKEHADKLALENAETRRELVRADEVGEGYIRLSTTISQRVQAIASRAAVDLAVESDVDACEELLERHLADALTELADLGESLVRDQRVDPAAGRARARGDAPAAEADDPRVGRQVSAHPKRHKPRSRKVAT